MIFGNYFHGLNMILVIYFEVCSTLDLHFQYILNLVNISTYCMSHENYYNY